MGCDRCISGCNWRLYYYLHAEKINLFETMKFLAFNIVLYRFGYFYSLLK